jgi:hypothetical protein
MTKYNGIALVVKLKLKETYWCNIWFVTGMAG